MRATVEYSIFGSNSKLVSSQGIRERRWFKFGDGIESKGQFPTVRPEDGFLSDTEYRPPALGKADLLRLGMSLCRSVPHAGGPFAASRP